MLSSFTIENFKSYHEASLKLAPLTVLIGANAAGKSNAVEALRLLSWIAAGNRLGTRAGIIRRAGSRNRACAATTSTPRTRAQHIMRQGALDGTTSRRARRTAAARSAGRKR